MNIEKVSLEARFISDSSWSLISNLASKVFSFLSIAIITRELGPRLFGLYGIILSIAYIFIIIGSFGMNSSVIKVLSEKRVKNPAEFSSTVLTSIVLVFVISLIFCGVFIVFINPISKYYNNEELYVYLWQAILLIASSIFVIFGDGLIQSLRLYKFYALRSILTSIIGMFLTIYLVKYYSISGALFASISINLLNITLLLVVIPRQIRKERLLGDVRINLKVIKPLLRYGFPILLAGIITVPVIWIANTAIFKEGGYDQVGIFNASRNLALQIGFISAAINFPIIRIYSDLVAQEDITSLGYIFDKNFKYTWLITITCVLLLGFNSKWIIHVIYGPQYAGSEYILLFLSIAVMFASLNEIFGSLYISLGKVWLGVITNLLWFIVIICSMQLLIPNLGALGAAMSYLLAYLTHTLVQNAISKKYVSISIHGKKFISSLLVLIILFWGIKNGNFWLNFILSILLSISLWSFLLEKDDKS